MVKVAAWNYAFLEEHEFEFTRSHKHFYLTKLLLLQFWNEKESEKIKMANESQQTKEQQKF